MHRKPYVIVLIGMLCLPLSGTALDPQNFVIVALTHVFLISVPLSCIIQP